MKKKSKTPFLDAFAKTRLMDEQVEAEREKLLARQGWEYSSENPGGLWLYQKKLEDGRIVLCDQALALHIESWICGEEYDECD